MTTIEQLRTPLRHESDPHRIAGQLQAMSNAALDVIVDQDRLSYEGDGRMMLAIPEPILTDNGVLADDVLLDPTRNAWSQLAGRLSIPIRYLDRIAEKHEDLTAQTIRTLLDEEPHRRAMLRLWQAEDGVLLRALVSDSFAGEIDNWSMFTSVLEGLQAAEILPGDCEIEADLTADRFRLRIAVPQIAHAVPDLLGDYRTPFSMNPNDPHHHRLPEPQPAPVIFAGLEIANSETGNGTYIIRPRAVVQICRNGLTKEAAFRRTHIGSKQAAEGEVRWSAETNEALRRLINSQTADAVRTFCSEDYLAAMAEEMRAAKAQPIEDAAAAMEVVAKRAELSDDEVAATLACFIRSGDMTRLGVGQAMTAAAQLSEDGDRQADIESRFWDVIRDPALV